MANRFKGIGFRYTDSAGDPLTAGKLYFYDTGTLDDKTVYYDEALTVPHAQPVVIEANGLQPDIWFSGKAKVRLYDQYDVLIDESDPEGTDIGAVSFPLWDSETIWNIPDVVKASDNTFWVSIQDSNQGNNPLVSPTYWSQIKLIAVWNTNQTYALNDVVQGSDGRLYRSLVAANVGNVVTDVTKWGSTALADIPEVLAAAGYQFAYNNF